MSLAVRFISVVIYAADTWFLSSTLDSYETSRVAVFALFLRGRQMLPIIIVTTNYATTSWIILSSLRKPRETRNYVDSL